MSSRTARIEREVRQLRLGYPLLSCAPGYEWVLIPRFRLPRGWEPQVTKVLIEPPPNYPEAAPDGFYMGTGLRRRDAAGLHTPGHYFDSYKNPRADQGYIWYCLEDEDSAWDPRFDSLLTFVEAIRTYLGSPD